MASNILKEMKRYNAYFIHLSAFLLSRDTTIQLKMYKFVLHSQVKTKIWSEAH